MNISYPRTIQIETLNSCNAKCVMCPASTTSRTRGIMTDRIFNTIIDEIKDFPEKPLVTLHGTGEPLLYKKLGERIQTASHHGLPVILTTNGSLMNRNRAFEVLDAGVERVQFSIESISKDIYENIRIGLKLDQVLNNLISFIELREKMNPSVKIELVMICYDDNKNSVVEYGDFCQRNLKAGDMLTVVHRHNFGNTYDSHLLPSDLVCSTLIDNISIQYDGIVNLCCVDSEQKYNMGNVLESKILDIFNSDDFRRYKNFHMSGQRNRIELCSNCTVPECHKLIRTYIIQ